MKRELIMAALAIVAAIAVGVVVIVRTPYCSPDAVGTFIGTVLRVEGCAK
jgi:hypothetical protein